jgi:hypothetical protein
MEWAGRFIVKRDVVAPAPAKTERDEGSRTVC